MMQPSRKAVSTQFVARTGISQIAAGLPAILIVMIVVLSASCTGARPVLVEPVPEPTLDAEAFAAALPLPPGSAVPVAPGSAVPVAPGSAVPVAPGSALAPTDASAPGEPTAEDAMWVWSQNVGLDYRGTCSSQTEGIPDAVCSVQIEDFDAFEIGPNADETWWVVVVTGSDASYRVEAVYPAGKS